MKLKELPISLFTAFKLKCKNLSELHGENRESLPVIISLTSIPSRLASLHLVIRSLLLQSKLPEKIFLWLHKDLRNQIPQNLEKLIGKRFEIRYVDLTCSHRKLVHALELFPESVIVTCDDDLMYDPTWLERLYVDHLKYPRDVIAHECREIKYHSKELAPYKEWKTQTEPGVTSDWMMPIGYGGVLYPPNSLFKDVTNSELYLKLAPRADDLWFKAMSYQNGTLTRRSLQPGKKPIPILGSQKVSLKHTNVRENGNFDQWKAICNYYRIHP